MIAIRRQAAACGQVLVLAASFSFSSLLAVAAAAEESGRAGKASPVAAAEREVTLAELLEFAETHALATRLAERKSGYAEAERQGARRWLRSNPSLEFGMGPRFDGNADQDFDFQVALAQPVEVAGQRGLRLEAAERARVRLEAETRLMRFLVRRDVTLAFHQAVVGRGRVALGERVVAFNQEMLRLAQRRLAAGDIDLIEVRVAETELSRAQQARLLAEQELRAARIRLAEVSGWSLEDLPLVPRERVAPSPPPALGQVLERARQKHPALVARRAAVSEADAQLELAKRLGWPTPSFGVQFAREGSAGSPANYILLGTLGLSLPVWERNQGERARAQVDRQVAEVEVDVAARALESRIVEAHAALLSASERLQLFTGQVAPALEENLKLLERGFAAGELTVFTLAVAKERFLEAERNALSAYADYNAAWAELELVTTGGAQ